MPAAASITTELGSHPQRTAMGYVRPSGRVAYSTCSIAPEENGGVVRAVLAQFPGWTLEKEHEHRPGQPADGGYWARLRRST
jgi:16S rRNA (cytosine967-C5)-methyltransferase